MKKALLVLLALGASLKAQAGSLEYTCKNRGNTVILTRYNLVVVPAPDVTTQRIDVAIMRNKEGDAPFNNSSFSFSELNSEAVVAHLKITGVTEPVTIAASDAGDSCPGGSPPGFSTEAYTVKGLLKLNGLRPAPVELNCRETAAWSGTCLFEDQK